MSKDSNELRADIAQTRDELRNDVDAIVDKVSPSHIAHRQTARIKDSVSRVKETVMGRSEDVSERTQQAAHDASDAVHEAPQKVAEQTRGNPWPPGSSLSVQGCSPRPLFREAARRKRWFNA